MTLSNSRDDKLSLNTKISIIDDQLQVLISKIYFEKIKEYVHNSETLDGNFCSLKVWKLKQKLIMKPKDPPMAKMDIGGNLVTSEGPLKALYLETYANRLKHKPILEM